MAEQNRLASKTAQRTMTIDGHRITFSFSQDRNQKLSSLVRTTLIDSYIRNNSIAPYEVQA